VHKGVLSPINVGGGCLGRGMSSGPRLPLGLLAAALDEILTVDPIYLTACEKQTATRELAKAEARLQAARLRLLQACEDVAEAKGARSAADWSARETREAPGAVRRLAGLAEALTSRWVQVADTLAAGVVNLAQARVVVEALDALPDGLGDDLRAKAEAYLVDRAADLGPRELRVLGSRILQYLAPEVADEVEYQRLVADEARAAAATRLSFKPRGDGSTDLHARIPDHVAGRLRTYLDAFTSPRRPDLDPGEVDLLPIARRRGAAFCALLENLPDTGLPTHGGTATSVMVTLDFNTLLREAGLAETSTARPSPASRPAGWPARPGSSPPSSAAAAKSSTSAAPHASSPRPSARR
jgi:Domain of unknown function (DUF222)